ncbi:MAG: hypothetical protein GY871_14060 [Actinomycetales bacterium]|nr:hypothetical protein [Actinomycetales bacterium]
MRRQSRLSANLFMDRPHHTARFFGGGTPIIQGGMSDAEMQAQLNNAALENEKMLAQSADEQLRLQSELDKRDQEMALTMKQQAATTELDLARAQKALDVEIDGLGEQQDEDALAADFSALEQALAAGLGGSDPSAARPE